MERLERFYKIDQLLRAQRVVPRETFLATLEVSLATFKRDLEYLRDRFGAPIEYDRDRQGYCYAAGSEFVLPGLWLSAPEIHALLTMQHLLRNLQPGILAEHLEPLLARIQALLGTGDVTLTEVERRIRILGMAQRPVDSQHFEIIASAVLSRQRLAIDYYTRARDELSTRAISPQRLVHYRDNWYLDAWCHLREGLRCFAVESIRRVTPLNTPAIDVDEALLDTELGSGYGIFTGAKVQHATLRFTPEAARWVASEQWHPQQRGEFDAEGYYRLSFPYSHDRELLMDILRHGEHVEVLAPDTLREKVRAAAYNIVARYADD